jgi:UV DNA damage endonuclease
VLGEPDLPSHDTRLAQFHRQVEECGAELAETGRIARERGIRLSTHPGQYTVLNSEKPEVRAAAAAELEVQAALLDAMELGPEAVVVLHVGGASGGVEAGLDRFMTGFGLLSERARARLVVENDDRGLPTRDGRVDGVSAVRAGNGGRCDGVAALT